MLIRNMGIAALIGTFMGLVPLGWAILYAFRPSEQRLALMRPLSLAAIFAAIHASALGVLNFFRGLGMSETRALSNAGLIGPISLNDVNAELRTLLESMKPGEVSQVIRLPRGYQLLKLETLAPAQTMTLEQAREQISERVFTDKRKAEFQKYLDKLRGQAIIDWKNDEIKKAYEIGLQQMAAQAPTGQP